MTPCGDELVTVVIPARDEQEHLGDCLESVLAQDWPLLEVLVVDGGSTDGTSDVARQFAAADPRVRLLSNPRRLIPVSLNLALAEARGTWLVRVDAHSTVPSHYVRTAVRHLQTGDYAAVGGRKDGRGRTTAGVAIAAAMGSRFGVGGSTYHHGTTLREVEHVPFGAYPVELLRRLGGWDERLNVNEDFELDYRIRLGGHRLLFDPAMWIDWRSRQSVPELFRQYHRYGRGKAMVARMHPASLRPRHLAAPALVALLAAAGAAGLTGHPRLAVTLTVPYTAALTLATAATAHHVPAPSRPWLAPSFAAMHVAWGLGFLRGLLDELRTGPAGRQPVRR